MRSLSGCRFCIPSRASGRSSESTSNPSDGLSPTNTANEYKKGFYSSTTYTDTLIDYLEDRPTEDKDKPFFAFLPFAVPHWPLQCSKEDREKYKVRYAYLR